MDGGRSLKTGSAFDFLPFSMNESAQKEDAMIEESWLVLFHKDE